MYPYDLLHPFSPFRTTTFSCVFTLKCWNRQTPTGKPATSFTSRSGLWTGSPFLASCPKPTPNTWLSSMGRDISRPSWTQRQTCVEPSSGQTCLDRVMNPVANLSWSSFTRDRLVVVSVHLFRLSWTQSQTCLGQVSGVIAFVVHLLKRPSVCLSVSPWVTLAQLAYNPHLTDHDFRLQYMYIMYLIDKIVVQIFC